MTTLRMSFAISLLLCPIYGSCMYIFNLWTTRRLESKLNTFIGKLKSNGVISEIQYKQIYASGSHVGALYGLAKTHKDNVPLRPIVTTRKTHNYNLAKYIIPMISHLATNEYVLKTLISLLKNYPR